MNWRYWGKTLLSSSYKSSAFIYKFIFGKPGRTQQLFPHFGKPYRCTPLVRHSLNFKERHYLIVVLKKVQLMKHIFYIIATMSIFSCSRGTANDAAFGLGKLITWTAIILLVIWIIKSMANSGNKKK